MSRPVNAAIKQKMLEDCFKVVLKHGTFDLGIHTLAERIESSARMIIYHFGSRKNLDLELALYLDLVLMEKFKEFAMQGHHKEKLLPAFWDYVTGDKKLTALLKLSLDHVGNTGKKPHIQKTLEAQTRLWLDLIRNYYPRKNQAEFMLLLMQGALIDFLMTGNKQRGKAAISTMISLKFENSK